MIKFLKKLFGVKYDQDYTIDCLALCGTPYRCVVSAKSEQEALEIVKKNDYIAKGILSENELAIDEKFHKSDHTVIRIK